MCFFYYFCSRTAAVASMEVIFATSMGKEHCLEPWGTLISGKTIVKIRPIAGVYFLGNLPLILGEVMGSATWDVCVLSESSYTSRLMDSPILNKML